MSILHGCVCVKKIKELQLSYFSICEGKKIDDKISELIALKAGSTVYISGRAGISNFYGTRQCGARFACPMMNKFKEFPVFVCWKNGLPELSWTQKCECRLEI